jgi:hypothetical protein
MHPDKGMMAALAVLMVAGAVLVAVEVVLVLLVVMGLVEPG